MLVNKLQRIYRSYYSQTIHGLMMLRNRHINRHIVVFESDDWGSIRMPSIETLLGLQRRGICFCTELGYDKVDTLASNDDLELLMGVLSSVKDSMGNPAKLTMNCVTANPDFEKIRQSGYKEYYYEPFTETLKKYPNHDQSFELLKDGIRHGVFMPQFHGREHLNVLQWLRLLQTNNQNVLDCFEEKMFSMQVMENGSKHDVLAAFNAETLQDIEFLKQSIDEGLEMFYNLFGFNSLSMIAPCYTWDSFIEDVSYKHGVKLIQGGYIQKHSAIERSKGNRVTGHFMGEKNGNGQIYTIRNCVYEPSQNTRFNSEYCFRGIQKAFSNHLPAVVSCHRLNFIGTLNSSNRDNNLLDFGRLLKKIVEKYPDVEFLSSDQCIDLF